MATIDNIVIEPWDDTGIYPDLLPSEVVGGAITPPPVTPSLQKPSGLVSLLGSLNWDILTFKVYVGDAVENAIDWVLNVINSVLGFAQQALAVASAAWNKITELWDALLAAIGAALAPILATIESWWSQLGDWWAATSITVKGWISVAIDEIRSLIAQISALTLRLQQWVDDFLSGILPGLAKLIDVQALIDSALGAWADLFKWWGTAKDMILAFFDNPIEFLWQKFADWFFGEE